MTIRDFLAVENLDESFRTVTVRFVAEGQEDIVMSAGLGKAISVVKIPKLDVGEDEVYQWKLIPSVTAETLVMGETAEVQYISKERLRNLLFDQTYEAVFDVKNMVVASEEKTAKGRPLALAVGAFDTDTGLNLTDVTAEEPAINGIPVAENWNVTMEDIGVERLHYHIPADVDAKQLALYVKDASGNWEQREFTVEGSYMIFSFTHGERGFALEVLPEEKLPVAMIGMIAGAVLLLVIGGGTLRKRSPKKKGTADEKQ